MSHLNNSIVVKDYSLDELIVADVRSSVYVRPVVEGLYHAFDNVSHVEHLTIHLERLFGIPSLDG